MISYLKNGFGELSSAFTLSTTSTMVNMEGRFQTYLANDVEESAVPPPQRCKDCLLNINKLSVVHRYSLLIAQCITSDTASIFCSWKRNWDMSTFHSVSYKQPTTLSITLGITGLKVWLEVFHCMQQIILLFIRLQLPLLLLQFFCGMLQPCFYNLPNFCLVRFQPLVFLYGSWNKFGDLF